MSKNRYSEEEAVQESVQKLAGEQPHNELGWDAAYDHIRAILESARQRAYAAVNFAMVEAYWEIGKSIVGQQGGADRAEYGSGLIKDLSKRLSAEFGKGFDESNLRQMRQFYLTFPIRDSLRHELTWTHYRHLIKVPDEKARMFYMEECAASQWSTRQLAHQIHTMFYERLLSSGDEDKQSVASEIQKSAPAPTPRDIIRDPYVLDFLDIRQSSKLYESNLEEALIGHLQEFLLELGRGFSFVARQKRISFDGRNFYIDLVFYNYRLRCFVLIDLKIGDLTHQDIGQMQMYVNYYTREINEEGDNPAIGLLLCADKSDAIVKYTLPEDNSQIFASKFLTYLPSEEELRREIAAEYRALSESRDLSSTEGENHDS